MSKQYLRNTIIMLVGAYVATGLAIQRLLAPVIQGLTSETKVTHLGSGLAIAVVSILAVLLSLAAVVLTARGLARDQARRWVWAILLVAGLIVFLNAAGFAVFAHLVKDIKLSS